VAVTRRTLVLGIVLMFLPGFAAGREVALNRKADGYRGIWYMNQPLKNVYRYKYSGGLGTYCAKHRPFAVYRPEVKKTFFCYGGTTKDSHRRLLHMVSYFDHETNTVPRPTLLLDKKTSDAHDNPVISVDDEGYVWIFSTSHGTSRPSYIHRSRKPYTIDAFELVPATRENDGRQVPITNFSYAQPWHLPDRGFVCFFTKYGWGSQRTLCFMSSRDGVRWSAWQRLATIARGHYQVSAASGTRAASAFNYHPKRGGLNYRTNLYYVETSSFGKAWLAVDGTALRLPLTKVKNAALVQDYESEGLKVYLKDLRFDWDGRPVILYVTSRGYESGPKNDPRTWTVAHWTGRRWDIHVVTTSDNNYDMGSLFVEKDGAWRIIAPTETGPQPYNPGGEMAVWLSRDEGKTWRRVRQITHNSARNHTYARAALDAAPEFYAIWADGHGRKPSRSDLYFCSRSGEVYLLPRRMTAAVEKPKRIEPRR
jgi:hypothetical protein